MTSLAIQARGQERHEHLARRQPAVAKEALERVADKATDAAVRRRAQNALERMNAKRK